MWFTIQGNDGETGCALSLTIDAPSLQSAREYALRKGIVVSTVLPGTNAGAGADPGLPPPRVIDYATPVRLPRSDAPAEPSPFGVVGKIGRVVCLLGLGAVVAGVVIGGEGSTGAAFMTAGLVMFITGFVIASFDPEWPRRPDPDRPPADPPREADPAAEERGRSSG